MQCFATGVANHISQFVNYFLQKEIDKLSLPFFRQQATIIYFTHFFIDFKPLLKRRGLSIQVSYRGNKTTTKARNLIEMFIL